MINAPRVHHSWPPKGRITAGNQKRRRKRLEREYAFRKWAADQLTKWDEENGIYDGTSEVLLQD